MSFIFHSELGEHDSQIVGSSRTHFTLRAVRHVCEWGLWSEAKQEKERRTRRKSWQKPLKRQVTTTDSLRVRKTRRAGVAQLFPHGCEINLWCKYTSAGTHRWFSLGKIQFVKVVLSAKQSLSGGKLCWKGSDVFYSLCSVWKSAGRIVEHSAGINPTWWRKGEVQQNCLLFINPRDLMGLWWKAPLKSLSCFIL